MKPKTEKAKTKTSFFFFFLFEFLVVVKRVNEPMVCRVPMSDVTVCPNRKSGEKGSAVGEGENVWTIGRANRAFLPLRVLCRVSASQILY